MGLDILKGIQRLRVQPEKKGITATTAEALTSSEKPTGALKGDYRPPR